MLASMWTSTCTPRINIIEQISWVLIYQTQKYTQLNWLMACSLWFNLFEDSSPWRLPFKDKKSTALRKIKNIQALIQHLHVKTPELRIAKTNMILSSTSTYQFSSLLFLLLNPFHLSIFYFLKPEISFEISNIL